MYGITETSQYAVIIRGDLGPSPRFFESLADALRHAVEVRQGMKMAYRGQVEVISLEPVA